MGSGFILVEDLLARAIPQDLFVHSRSIRECNVMESLILARYELGQL